MSLGLWIVRRGLWEFIFLQIDRLALNHEVAIRLRSTFVIAKSLGRLIMSYFSFSISETLIESDELREEVIWDGIPL